MNKPTGWLLTGLTLMIAGLALYLAWLFAMPALGPNVSFRECKSGLAIAAVVIMAATRFIAWLADESLD